MPADLARQMARLALCAWPRLAACQTILNAIGSLLAGGCQVEEFLFAEDIFGFFGKLPIHRCLGPKTAELAVKEHHVLLDGLAADVQAIGGGVRVGGGNRHAAQNRRGSGHKKSGLQSRGPAQRNIEKGIAEIGPVGFVLASERKLRPVSDEVAARVPQTRGYRYVVASNRVLLVGTSRIVVGAFADANARRAKDAGRLRIHQVRLKPALRLFEMSPVGVSLTEPGTLNGPPNSCCSALSVRSHLSSMLEMSAPTDTLVSVGRMLKRSAWLVAQVCTCPVAFGSARVSETPFCSVNETSSPTGTERLNVVPSLPCSCDGSTRVSI